MGAFERWNSLGDEQMQTAVRRAAEMLTSLPVRNGFALTRRAFDSGDPPPYAINLERSLSLGETSYITIGFDKRHRPRFQIGFGTKTSDPPHRWVSAGALVWKNGSELQRFKWWGAKWWQPCKLKVFDREAERAAALMPQVLEFLRGGAAGSHVFVSWPKGDPADAF